MNSMEFDAGAGSSCECRDLVISPLSWSGGSGAFVFIRA